MATVTRGSLADLKKLEKGKQILDQYRVCEVSYTYVRSDDKILPARGLLLQFGTGDVKLRETEHDFEVPIDSRVTMTLTLVDPDTESDQQETVNEKSCSWSSGRWCHHGNAIRWENPLCKTTASSASFVFPN